MKRFLFLSALLALVLSSLLLLAIWLLSTNTAEWITGVVPWKWAQQSWIFGIILSFGLVYICFIAFKYLMLICLSPVLSYLSEKVEEKVRGQSVHQAFKISSAISRSIRINSRNLSKELVITVTLMIASLFPGFQIITVPAIFLVQAYFMGFGFMDYCMERHYSYSQSLEVIRYHRGAAIGIGGLFSILFMIPIFGIIVAPYLLTITSSNYILHHEIINNPSKF